MRGLNKVHLIGTVETEPEVKYTDQRTARTAFGVAVNRQWKDAEGHVQQGTEWLPVLFIPAITSTTAVASHGPLGRA